MFMVKGLMLSRSQSVCPGSVEVPKARLLPDGRISEISPTGGLKGLCVMSTSSPTVLLTRIRTGGIADVPLASPFVQSPPWGVSEKLRTAMTPLTLRSWGPRAYASIISKVSVQKTA